VGVGGAVKSAIPQTKGLRAGNGDAGRSKDEKKVLAVGGEYSRRTDCWLPTKTRVLRAGR
jgi:hypothetical protein